MLEKNLYRKITKVAYSENKPVERVVNDMLREYIDVFFPLRKIGLVHVTKDTVKMIFQDISDELLTEHARDLSKRYMEVITLLNKNRTLDDYLDFFKTLFKCKWVSSRNECESVRKYEDNNETQSRSEIFSISRGML